MPCPGDPGPRPHFIPVAKTAQVTMKYTEEGQVVENVYHVLGTAEWDATSLDALTADFETWETANARLDRGDAVILIEVTAVALFTQDGPLFVSSVSIQGSVAHTLLPNNVSIALKWGTGIRGRSFRGRTYWIGLTENMRDTADTNKLGIDAITEIKARGDALLITPFANGGKLAVVSYQHDCAWRSSGLATPIINCGFTDHVFDSQRRRLPSHNVHH